jgi:CcmD family protein
MPYLVAAYVVIWLVIFLFILTMNRRLSTLDDELTALEEALTRQETR